MNLDAIMKLSSGGTLEYENKETFVDMFLREAEAHGGATACADDDGKMSYSDLALASKVVAHRLIELGVKPNDFVLVKMPRCKEILIPLIGCHRAGACYVPVDPEYPAERIDYMVKDCGAKVTIDVDWLLGLRKHYGLKALTLPKINLAMPDTLAYMLYTSGSTGRPKGVMLPHRALRAFIAWQINRFKLKPGCRTAEHCSFCFDLSMMDLCGTVAAGGEVHIIPEEIRTDLDAVNTFLTERKIEGMVLGTQFGTELLNNCEVPFRYVLLCGEKLLPFRKQRADLEVVNLYGPTEFTIGCTDHIVNLDQDAANIPIGRPFPNTWNFIVDKDLNLVERGEVGELCLAGAQLGCGYWNQPEKTAAAFVDCPFLPGEKMYRTGDLAKWNERGELLCLGRMDHQVKIRGFRIELGEIENVAKTFPGINLVAAAAKEVGGIKHLVLYYTKEGEVASAELKAHLEKSLAYYMIPEAFIELDAMPMTPNGKIDRKQLPDPAIGRSVEYVEPANAKEKLVVETVREVLSLPAETKIGALDNFFALGGESLKAIRLVAVLKKKGFVVTAADVMKANTLRELAAVEPTKQTKAVEAKSPLDDAPWTREQRIAAVQRFAEKGLTVERAFPVTGLQELMAMASDEIDKGVGFNELLRYDLDVLPTEAQLRAALKRLVRQHDSFRTAILFRELDEPVQVILKEREIALEIEDISTLSPSAQAAEKVRAAEAALARPFDPELDALARVKVLKTSPTNCHLLFSLHHSIFDGASYPVFIADFRRFLAYEMLSWWRRPFAFGLLPKKVRDGRFERFVRTIRAMDMAPAKEYWTKLTGDWDDKSILPGTTDIPPAERAQENLLSLSFSKATTEKIHQIVRAEHATFNTFFELVWGRVLQTCNAKNDVLFVKLVARRELAEEDAQDAVGIFMGAIAIRVKNHPGETVREALRALQRQSADSAAYQYCSEYALAEIGARGMDSFQSLVVSANYGAEDGGVIPGAVVFHQLPNLSNSANELEIRPHANLDGSCGVDILFRTDLFSAADIEKGAAAIRRVVEAMVENPDREFISIPAYGG